MHVNIGNTDTVTNPVFNFWHQCHWCCGKNPCLLLNEYIFPMQGHFVEFAMEFQALKLTSIPPIPWLYHSFDTNFSIPCSLWICFIHCIYYSVISPSFLLCSCAFFFLMVSCVRSERVKGTRMERKFRRFLYISGVQPLILYSDFSC